MLGLAAAAPSPPARSPPPPLAAPVPPRAAGSRVGLLNSGALCYLNALLQLLYAVPALRRRVMGWAPPSPLDAAAERRTVPAQLARLFAALTLSRRSCVSTADLVGAFGWRAGEGTVQNDAHECLTVLLEALQRDDGGSALAAPLEGAVQHYVRCGGCGNESVRDEPFNSLTLAVRGCSTVAAAVAQLLADEALTGDNAYACDVCAAKRDATKGVRLIEAGLPPALLLHLNRFEFDYETLMRRKVTDRLEPDVELRLPTAGGGGVTYRLGGLAVHLGASAGSGHYIAYVLARSPGSAEGSTPAWVSLNDSAVAGLTDAQARAVLGDAVAAAAATAAACTVGAAASSSTGAAGGDGADAGAAPVTAAGGGATQLVADAAARGAYLLLYVRSDAWDAFIAGSEGGGQDVPDALHAAVAADNASYAASLDAYAAQRAQRRFRIYGLASTIAHPATSGSPGYGLRRSGDGSRPAVGAPPAPAVAAPGGGRAPPLLVVPAPQSGRDASPVTARSTLLPSPVGWAAGAAGEAAPQAPAPPRPAAQLLANSHSAPTLSTMTLPVMSSNGSSTHAFVDVTLHESRGLDELLRAAVAAATRAITPLSPAAASAADAQISLYRLRRYHVGRCMPLAPLAAAPLEVDSPFQGVGGSIGALGLGTPSSSGAPPEALFLERRESVDAPWLPWRDGMLPFSALAAPWLGPARGLGAPVRIVVCSGETTVGELRRRAVATVVTTHDGVPSRVTECDAAPSPAALPRLALEDGSGSLGRSHELPPLPRLVLLRDAAAAAAAGTPLAVELEDDGAVLTLVEQGKCAAASATSEAVEPPPPRTLLPLSDGERVAVVYESIRAPPFDAAGEGAPELKPGAPAAEAVQSWWIATVFALLIDLAATPVPAHGGGPLPAGAAGRLPLRLRLDRRCADVAQLREAAAATLGLPRDAFKLREATSGAELKDGARLLDSIVGGSGGGVSVTIEAGRPLDAGEFAYRVTLLRHDGRSTPVFEPLGVAALRPSASTAEAKVDLARQLLVAGAAPLLPPHFRIRERGAGDALAALYVDAAPLLRCGGGRAFDGKEIVLQPCVDAAAAAVGVGDVAVRLRRWRPAASIDDGPPLSEAVEAVLCAAATAPAAAAATAARALFGFGPGDTVVVAKLAAWQLAAGGDAATAALRRAAWERVGGSGDSSRTTDGEGGQQVVGAPATAAPGPALRIVAGDTIVVAALHEFDDHVVRTSALLSPLAGAGSRAALVPPRSASSSSETGFQIFSPKQQIEREAAAAAAEAAAAAAAEAAAAASGGAPQARGGGGRPQLSFLGELRSRSSD